MDIDSHSWTKWKTLASILFLLSSISILYSLDYYWFRFSSWYQSYKTHISIFNPFSAFASKKSHPIYPFYFHISKITSKRLITIKPQILENWLTRSVDHRKTSQTTKIRANYDVNAPSRAPKRCCKCLHAQPNHPKPTTLRSTISHRRFKKWNHKLKDRTPICSWAQEPKPSALSPAHTRRWKVLASDPCTSNRSTGLPLRFSPRVINLEVPHH